MRQLTGTTASASSSELGNGPANVLDGNLSTRWSGNGTGVTLTVDFGKPVLLTGADVAWYHGASRVAAFALAVSTDKAHWTQIYTGSSNGKTASFESYPFGQVTARYLQLTGYGNSQNSWSSVIEFRGLTPQQGSQLLVGNASVASVPDQVFGGSAEAFSFTAFTGGVLQTLKLYVDAANGASVLRIAVYDDSSRSPGALKAECTLNNPSPGAWNTCVPLTGVSIAGGATYWVAVLSPAGGGVAGIRDETGGVSHGESNASLADFPSTWSTGPAWSSQGLSFQGLGTAGGSTSDGGVTPPPDTTPPTAPAGLVSTAVSSSQVSLTWNAATDNVAVTGYRVYRGTSLVATLTALTFLDSALAASTPYTYSVRAFDAAGNLGAASTSVTVTTGSGGFPSGSYPDATTTGPAAAGYTTLTDYTGSLGSQSSPVTGTLTAKRIDVGSGILWLGNNAILQGCEVFGGGSGSSGFGLIMLAGSGIQILDSSVHGNGTTTATSVFSWVQAYGGGANTTIKRSNFYNSNSDGLRIEQESGWDIEDNYLHDWVPAPTDSPHDDAIVTSGNSASMNNNLTIRHNTVLMWAPGHMTDVIAFPEQAHNVIVDNNLLGGGGYCAQFGGPASANFAFTNNQVSTQFTSTGGANGVPFGLYAPNWTLTSNPWHGNVWHDGPNAGRFIWPDNTTHLTDY